MGEKDVASKNYLSDCARFAQICNNELFGGHPIIRPEKLRELDPVELRISGMTKKETENLKKERDILKQYDNELYLLFIGIENQTKIHYCMPLRTLLHDTLNYERQRAAIERRHNKLKDLADAEYIGGFAKDDRLIPVMTLIIYWGTETWDGPKTLHQLLDIPPALAEYKDMIPDYRIHLLDICHMENLEQYEGELKALFGFARYQKEKEILRKFIDENKSLFQDMSLETAQAISILTKAPNIQKYINKQEKEVLDMCLALDEWGQDLKEEGMKKGIQYERHSAIRELLKKLTPTEIINLDYYSKEEVQAVLKG